MTPLFWLAIALFILVLFAVFAWRLRIAWSRNRLRGRKRLHVLSSLEHARALDDPHRRILEAESVLAKALETLGYRGTMAEKLQKAEAYLPDKGRVWSAHKLRNRIAHEVGSAVSTRELEDAFSAFEESILRLCR